jgi:hypothetical protein
VTDTRLLTPALPFSRLGHHFVQVPLPVAEIVPQLIQFTLKFLDITANVTLTRSGGLLVSQLVLCGGNAVMLILDFLSGLVDLIGRFIATQEQRMDGEGAYALVLPTLQSALKGVVELAIFLQSFCTAGHVQFFIGPDAMLGASLAMLFDLDGWFAVDAVLHAQFAPVSTQACLLVQRSAAGQNQQPG